MADRHCTASSLAYLLCLAGSRHPSPNRLGTVRSSCSTLGLVQSLPTATTNGSGSLSPDRSSPGFCVGTGSVNAPDPDTLERHQYSVDLELPPSVTGWLEYSHYPARTLYLL